MKVLHVININAVGGAEKLLIDFLPALRNEGSEIYCIILCPSKNNIAANNIRSKLESNGIKVYFREYTSLFSLLNFQWIRRIVREVNPDLLHTHLRYADIWIVALKSLGFLKCPVVSTVHGYNDRYMNKHGLQVAKGIKFTFYYWSIRWVSKRLNGLVFISNCMFDFYKKCNFIGNGRSTVIYHGYAINDFPSKEENKEWFKDEIKLVLPGRIVERKGHKYALEALAILRSRSKNASLHFLGEGPFRSFLEKECVRLKVSDYVFFHGFVENLAEELLNYDIALLPSYWEPFGLVFLDAFAAKLPVVAFDIPAGNEIVENERNGFLVQPFDSRALVNAIVKLSEDKSLCINFGNMGYVDLNSKFSMSVMTNKYLSFYNLLLTSEQ